MALANVTPIGRKLAIGAGVAAGVATVVGVSAASGLIKGREYWETAPTKQKVGIELLSVGVPTVLLAGIPGRLAYEETAQPRIALAAAGIGAATVLGTVGAHFLTNELAY